MSQDVEKVKIKRILGISATSNAHFDCDSGVVAYPAGNTIVLLNIETGEAITHVPVETKKSITSLQLTNSLLFVASDETSSFRIINWETHVVKDISPCQNVICCAVSTAFGILVTVGSDRVVSVWDFKGLLSNSTPNGINSNATRGRKLASSSVAGKVSCVTFSPDGKYFVTGGTRHLKFWYLQLGKNECVLTGRPAILGSEHSSADFRDVITDGQATYCIANFEGTSATLCQLCPRRFLDKWVQLKTSNAYCMCIEDDLIFVGCADGIIRCFRAGKLEFVSTLPLPHHLGIDIAAATNVSFLSLHPPGAKFPNVLAIKAPGGQKVVAVYADRSLYTWDVQDVKRSWLWHSGCIWDIAFGSPSFSNSSSNEATVLQRFPFVTCSNDDTIRSWDISSQTKSNLYSNECADIKYVSTRHLDSPLFISHGNGVRCVGVKNLHFLCCGDRQGNLRIWGTEMKNEVIKVKAHKEEILSIDVKGTLVATASRDGFVNLYNIGNEIDRVSSVQQHNGSVTCVKFVFSDRTASPAFQLVSCGADKTFVLRQLLLRANTEELSIQNFLSVVQSGSASIDVKTLSVVTSKTSLFDLETDSNAKHILLACQDACVRVYNISNGKHSKTLRAQNVQSGGSGVPSFIKLCIDPSGYYVAVAATDKAITIFDYYKGDVVSVLLGHSELATSIKFTPDYQNLLSVGGDSCIFVWALSREMIVTMKTRISEKKSRLPPPPTKPVSSPSPSISPMRPDYLFNFGQLPEWAKKQMSGEKIASSPAVSRKPSVALPQGKWSERVEKSTGPLIIKSFYDSDTVVPRPKSSGSSKETSAETGSSSMESYTNIKQKETDAGLSLVSSKHEESHDGREDDEELQSSDFYSDINKSTDGEFSDTRYNKTLRSESDTDESSSTKTGRSAPSKRLINSLRESKSSVQPFDIMRSRNTELIMSVKAKNREISKSRLELEKRLEATRKKLQSIGYKKMSQSTQDLSLHRNYANASAFFPKQFIPNFLQGTNPFISQKRNSHFYFRGATDSSLLNARNAGNTFNHFDVELHTNKQEHFKYPGFEAMRSANEFLDDSEEHTAEESSGIRRACSLSDLNSSNALPNGPTPRAPPSRKRSFSRHRKSKGSSGHFDAQNMITRSTSMSALAMSQLPQSDSEPESLPMQPSYMSKTISSQGKSRGKQPPIASAYSQENLRVAGETRIRVSSSEQNLFKSPGLKLHSPMARHKGAESDVKQPQQVYGVSKGLAVVTGVRQGGRDEIHLNAELASSTVDALRKSLDQVIHLKDRVLTDRTIDQEPIVRILDDGLRNAQTLIQESVIMQDLMPKIISEHEPAIL